MKIGIIHFFILVLLVGCSPQGTQTPRLPANSVPQITPTPFPISENEYEVVAWVDNPSPPRDSRIIVWGSLIKHGVHLGGMMMRATWPDVNQERGVPNCRVQVIYGSGVCIVETEGFQLGVFVPITVAFDYDGRTFIGQTGFTPQ